MMRGSRVVATDRSAFPQPRSPETKVKRILSFVTLLFLMAAGPASASDRLQIVASFSILGDMVRQVTGDLADVTTIVGPDADAHLYQPNTADAKAVAGADIVFVNGLGFETWSVSYTHLTLPTTNSV